MLRQMRRLAFGFSLAVGISYLGVACSAGKTSPIGPTQPGAVAGSTGASGSPATQAGAPGVSSGGNGFMLDLDAAAQNMDSGPDAPIEAGICDDQSIQTYELVPTVLLLVDTSSSMFDQRTRLWDPLFNALMDPTNGVVATLQSKVRFGFTSYKSVTAGPGDTACPSLVNIEPKINNFDTIKAAYTSVGVTPTVYFKWETPTGASVAAVAKTLADFKPDPPGPKFILLVTDGDPDTCTVHDPQCGQDESIKAVQDAYAAGIGTFAIGIGDILSSSDMTMRVGKDHLQDLANAGSGQPVAANSVNYSYSQCVALAGGLKASYAAVGQTPGTAAYFTVSATDGTSAQTELSAAILASLAQTRSCTFNMDAKVTGDASLGTLTVNGQVLPYGDANGWQLGTDLVSVTLNGSACDAWKKDGGKLNVVFPCKLVPVEHIDVPPPR